jgi:mannose-6-phosphate isomerase-like protein (cupin superfamily)
MGEELTSRQIMVGHDARYNIDTDSIMFDAAEKFDVKAVSDAQTPWWNRTLCAVNDAWVRLGVLEGDFHWHKHDDADEFFLVMEGHLDIELEDCMVNLEPGQAFTVPKGVMHCPHARGRSVVLMVEQAGVVPTGD